MYELLTAEDKSMINHYITANVGYPQADLKYILRFWDRAKSDYLSKLFKDQLIISTPIFYSESLSDIMDHLDKFVYRDIRCCRFIERFKMHFQTMGWTSWQNSAWKRYQNIADLVSYKPLAENRISYDMEINDWKFTKGTKTIKIIAKIAKSLKIGLEPDEDGISDFEYFRRRHSLALNTKKLFGNLCLSIHPLDYMTMSDNSNGWSSCMSWEEAGEYRMGTVEMMNSPCVVVAYLASEDETLPISGYNWNSKKWRSLFIVDPNFIANVKAYPYENENLTKEVMKKLAELAGWAPQEPDEYSVYNESDEESYINDKLIRLYFNTDKMYNDFGSTTSFLLINPEYGEPELINIDYNYSGEAECMACGGTEVSREDTLFCEKCDPSASCMCCGEYCCEEDLITLGDGMEVCSDCFDEDVGTDAITGEHYIYSYLTPVYLYDDNDEITSRFIYLYNTDKFLTPEYTTLNTLRLKENSFKHYVNVSDLTPEGLALFDED